MSILEEDRVIIEDMKGRQRDCVLILNSGKLPLDRHNQISEAYRWLMIEIPVYTMAAKFRAENNN